jgi:hypothetical protein
MLSTDGHRRIHHFWIQVNSVAGFDAPDWQTTGSATL